MQEGEGDVFSEERLRYPSEPSTWLDPASMTIEGCHD